MELTEVMELWKTQNQKIEKTLQINTKLLKENIESRVRSTLFGLKAIRVVGIVIGILWCTLISLVVIFSWDKTNWFFKAALIIHILVSLTAVVFYVYHLLIIQNFNYNQPVALAQQRLLKLKLSNLRTLGLLWVQLPVFSMWFMSDEWMINSPSTFWFLQMPIVLIQLFIGIWLYRNLTIKNQHKKWFQWFISRGEFGKIQKASELLEEINQLNNA